MSTFILADHYRAAKILLPSEAIHLRQEAIDTIVKDINTEKVIELTRRYFGLPMGTTSNWFADSFRATDASFSLIDNEHEASVLSAGLLKILMNTKKDFIPLTILSASILRRRMSTVSIDIIETAENILTEISIDERKHKILNTDKIQKSPETSLPSPLSGTTVPQALEFIKTLNAESHSAIDSLASQVAMTFKPLISEIQFLREEIDMQWWYIGEFSRIINQPFFKIPPASSAVLAGIELADLSTTLAGPVAAQAILQRIIYTISEKNKIKSRKFTIHDVVQGFSIDNLQRIDSINSISKFFDICPILTALAKAKDIGGETDWHTSFSNATHLKVDMQFTLFELALQAYRERQMSYI